MSFNIPNVAALLTSARNSLVLMDDFVGATPVGTSSPFSLRASGTGAGASLAALIGDDSPGVVDLTTGSTDTGEAALLCGYDAAGNSTNGNNLRWPSSGVTTVFEARVKVVNLSSNGVEEATHIIGLGTSIAYAHFKYDLDLSANWIVVNDNAGSSPTSTTSSVAVSSSVWVRLKIVVEGTSRVSYFLDDALVASHTTDVPASGVPIVQVTKTVGTTPYTLRCDYIAASQSGLVR